jgi:hypothetical protein
MPRDSESPEGMIARAEAVYLDASALIKINIVEPPGDNAVRLIYISHIPCYTSQIAFGELISYFSRRNKQHEIGGPAGYLFNVRAAMIDFEMKKIRVVEPRQDKLSFIRLAERLLQQHGKQGGGDVWHLMTTLELQRRYPATILLTFDQKLVSAAKYENIAAVYGHDLKTEALVAELKAAGQWIAS